MRAGQKSRRAAVLERSMTLAGRGFSFEVDPAAFKATSTLAQDVEESFTVLSRNNDSAARLWALLREGDPRRAARLSGEVEQLDFAELPGWLRKHGVEYDLERGWKNMDPPARAASGIGIRWRTASGLILVKGTRAGERAVFRLASVRAMGLYPDFSAARVVAAAGFSYGVPPSRRFAQVVGELRHAVLRVIEDQRGSGASDAEIVAARREAANLGSSL